jgi:hypothetical protein
MAVTLSITCLSCLCAAPEKQIHRNGFEGRQPYWVRGSADAPFRVTVHEITDLTAHAGQSSEHIELAAERGTSIYYVYPTPKAPIDEELIISLWLKSNRPGLQLSARVVLPHQGSTTNLEDRLTTILRGDQYQAVGRWQRLELRNPIKLAKEQQQLMRAELKGDVDFREAYIDRLLLNLYSGPGRTEVWIDDLEIGPVLEESPRQPTARPDAREPESEAAMAPPHAARPSVPEVKQDRLVVADKPFFMRGIRHSDTPLSVLRDAGFNTVWFDTRTPPSILEEAVNLGFWLVPSLPSTANGSEPGSPPAQLAARFGSGDSVLFWDLGGGLVEERRDDVQALAEQLHSADPQRALGGDIWDGFRAYSRTLDLVGTHRWPLLTSLELSQYHDWLQQRRALTRTRGYFWTWIQTQLPDWYTTLVYNRPAAAGFTEPVGPQPEQLRLLTYTALAAGCRGLGFWSDRFLADSHQGRDRLLMLALLNLELQMLEPMLVTAEPPAWVKTSIPEVKAAVMRTDRGVLVLPIWFGKGSQFVPGQLATPKLTVVVPEVPIGTQAWEISPAQVRSLQSQRVAGGTELTIPEFGLTAAVLFTGDNGPSGMVVRLQDQVRRMRKLAAQWSHDLAEVELDKVVKIESQLEAAGHNLPDGQKLLNDCRARLRSSVEHWSNGDYTQACREAERSMRPLRILMRAHWDEATHSLDSPVASPYAVSFYTLPAHWRYMTLFTETTAPNLLAGGGFEENETGQNGWLVQQSRLDSVDFTARPVKQEPKEGKQCLLLEIKSQGEGPPPKALERAFLAVRSPTLRIQPGTPVRISAWIRIPQAITASVDGALFYDSVGGEPLAIRLSEPTGWKKLTLYRTVPQSGMLYVTLAHTGLGKVFFDDVRIEAMPQPGNIQAVAR